MQKNENKNMHKRDSNPRPPYCSSTSPVSASLQLPAAANILSSLHFFVLIIYLSLELSWHRNNATLCVSSNKEKNISRETKGVRSFRSKTRLDKDEPKLSSMAAKHDNYKEVLPQLSGFVCAYHPAAPGSSPNRTIYALSLSLKSSWCYTYLS